MFYKSIVAIIFLIAFTNQTYSQSQNNLKEINEVWDKFYQAFDSLDYRLMAEIHSKRLIRISGGKRISDYETYISNYKSRFQEAKGNNITNNISLRFFERISSDSIASERGIYKLIRTENQENEQIYFGQFHVIFTKENNMWKILMDYDSNEQDSIGEKNYLNAHGINDFDKFIQN